MYNLFNNLITIAILRIYLRISNECIFYLNNIFYFIYIYVKKFRYLNMVKYEIMYCTLLNNLKDLNPNFHDEE